MTKRLTVKDFDPEVLKLFDQYVHGQLDRRGFLSQAGRYAVGGATAASLLSALSPTFAAQMVAPADPRIKAVYAEYPSPNGYGKLRRCTDERKVIVEFWLCLAAAFTVIRRLINRARSRYRGPPGPPPADSADDQLPVALRRLPDGGGRRVVRRA